MTDEELNVWERQPNVCRVLISREMGAWLKRRDENKAKQQPTVCDIEQIRAEIEDLDRYYDNDYFSTNNCPMYKCNEVLQIIDRHTKGAGE